MTDTSRKQVTIWLIVVCFFVFLIVAVGGMTRLTGSGLSMVDWKPLSRHFPPVNAQQWAAEF